MRSKISQFFSGTFFLMLASGIYGAAPEWNYPQFESADWDRTYMQWLQINPEFLPQDISSFLISPPPDESTQNYRMDLELLLMALETRDSNLMIQVNKAAGQVTQQLLEILEIPKPEQINIIEFQRKLERDTAWLILRLKAYYNRARPPFFIEYPPCLRIPGCPSYPSGYTTDLQFTSLFLQKLYPSKATLIEKEANNRIKLRLLSGISHPTDIAAGQELGHKLFNYLFSHPQFIRQFTQLQENLNHVPTK